MQGWQKSETTFKAFGQSTDPRRRYLRMAASMMSSVLRFASRRSVSMSSAAMCSASLSSVSMRSASCSSADLGCGTSVMWRIWGAAGLGGRHLPHLGCSNSKGGISGRREVLMTTSATSGGARSARSGVLMTTSGGPGSGRSGVWREASGGPHLGVYIWAGSGKEG